MAPECVASPLRAGLRRMLLPCPKPGSTMNCSLLKNTGFPLILLTPLLFVGRAQAQALVFDDVAVATGTVNVSFGRACALVDLDRDGLLDLICADDSTPNRFFRQRADGTFEDVAALWGVGLAAELDWGVLAADFDNDGDDDVYFANGGSGDPEDPNRILPNRLLRNDLLSTGKLVDVSSLSGDANDTNPTFGATALDYDRDGFLDIFCANPNRTCLLLRNEGGLTFSDRSSEANLVEVGGWRHPGSADYDNDGWPDVGVGNKLGPNALYRNQQDGTFVDRAAQAGVLDPNDNFGMVFQDYDNDGFQDIYVAKYQLVPQGPSPVYLNNGDGTFRNVSAGSGMGAHTDMGHNSGDLDADGYPEIMMGTGNPFYGDIDRLYRVLPNGSGGLTITDISLASGFSSGGATRQHGQALGDYDRDGDIDVFCNNGGPSYLPGTIEGSFLWSNRGNGNNWTALDLEGRFSNRTGVGTWARARTDTGRDVYRTLAVGQGFSNTSDHALHFGIGSDGSFERIELHWPSGIVQAIDQPALKTYIRVVETGAILRGSPAVGQFANFDISGRVGDVVELGLSLGTTAIELAGVNGTLELGSPYALLPSLPLDGGGLQSVAVPIPANASLVGVTVYAQAWVHDNGGLGTLSQLISFTIQ